MENLPSSLDLSSELQTGRRLTDQQGLVLAAVDSIGAVIGRSRP